MSVAGSKQQTTLAGTDKKAGQHDETLIGQALEVTQHSVSDTRREHRMVSRRMWKAALCVGVVVVLASYIFWPRGSEQPLPGPTVDPKPMVTGEGPKVAVGRADCALEFDGKPRIVIFPSLQLNYSHPITWDVFVTPRQSPGAASNSKIVGTGAGGLSQEKSGIWLNSLPGSNRKVYSDKPFEQGRRTHLAGVWDGTVLRLFVDGKLQKHIIKPGMEAEGPLSHVRIGANYLNDEKTGKIVFRDGTQFHGLIDEVRISNIARYTKDFEPPSSGARFEPDEHTLALYHFDEGKGDVLKDSSGNGHHGKIVGAKWVNADGTEIVEAVTAR